MLMAEIVDYKGFKEIDLSPYIIKFPENLPGYETIELELINNLGQIIYTGKLIQNQDFSNLNNGVYFLINKDHSLNYKLLKQD